MQSRSNRPRSLRELRPDLFVASRRHRARDAAQRARGALLRFFGRLVRQQGEDWRATCDDLRKQLAAAKREADDSAREVRTLRRAVQVADAAARHADGERDDALRVSARWEIEAADLRDQLTEALALLESERAAWREERAGKVRERQVFADALVDAADPDPRQGTPGGTDLLDLPEPQARWAPPAAGPVYAVRLPSAAVPPLQHCGALMVREGAGHRCAVCGITAQPVPPPPPAAPEVNRVPDMSRRPAAGQGTGEGGSANAFTASVPEGDDE